MFSVARKQGGLARVKKPQNLRKYVSDFLQAKNHHYRYLVFAAKSRQNRGFVPEGEGFPEDSIDKIFFCSEGGGVGNAIP